MRAVLGMGQKGASEHSTVGHWDENHLATRRGMEGAGSTGLLPAPGRGCWLLQCPGAALSLFPSSTRNDAVTACEFYTHHVLHFCFFPINPSVFRHASKRKISNGF